jgi:hypothetical protein
MDLGHMDFLVELEIITNNLFQIKISILYQVVLLLVDIE